MNKRILLFAIACIFPLSIGAEDFRYDYYSYLETNEWRNSYGFNEPNEVRIVPYRPKGKLYQQLWWNGSIEILEEIEPNIYRELSSGYRRKIYLLRDGPYYKAECLDDDLYSTLIRRSEGEYSDGITGKWLFSRDDEIKYEIRELENDPNYVYMLYVEGLVRQDPVDNHIRSYSGTFLLKERSLRTFETDGVFEQDAYKLFVNTREELLLYPEFEDVNMVLPKRYQILAVD